MGCDCAQVVCFQGLWLSLRGGLREILNAMSCGVNFAKTWGEKSTLALLLAIPNPSKRWKKGGGLQF